MTFLKELPGKVREWAARWKSPARSVAPVIGTSQTSDSAITPAEESQDEFQLQQAAALKNIFQEMKNTGGTVVVNGKHMIPHIEEVAPPK